MHHTKNSKAFNQSQKLLYLLFNLVYIEFHGGNIFEEVNGWSILPIWYVTLLHINIQHSLTKPRPNTPALFKTGVCIPVSLE